MKDQIIRFPIDRYPPQSSTGMAQIIYAPLLFGVE